MGAWGTYSLQDFLLFSPRVYWRLFELHNAEVWPAQIPALLLGIGLLALCLRPRTRSTGAVLLTLAFLWLWVGWSFLWERYATINWAIVYLVPGFVAEAVLLAAIGVKGKGMASGIDRSFPGTIGLILFSYALFLHPLVAPISGRPVEAAELFGIAPDPTAIASFGIVLMTVPLKRFAWILLPIPLIWCLFSGFTLIALDAWESWIPLTAAGISIVFSLARQSKAT